jgi:DNA-binding MarR family transcriptional regulator
MATQENTSIQLTRETADEFLYESLRAVYHFERSMVDRFGLGFKEIYLLQLLRRRESARIGEIATALGVPIFSTTRMVQRLELLGYVSKKRDETDRRGVSVRLESTGDSLVEQIEAYNFGLIVGSASTLTGDEQAAFVTVARSIDRVSSVPNLKENFAS